MFNIYINRIFERSFNGLTQFFADDQVLIYAEDDLEILQSKINADLIELQKFMSSNFLKINENKTVYMLFDRRGEAEDIELDLKLQDAKIKRVSEFKYLGLTLDEGLTWKSHVQNLKQKITPLIYLIGRSRKFLPEKTAWMLYYAHIYSHLSYMSMSWANTTTTELKGVQILQNKAIKLITRKPHLTETKTLYNEERIPVSVLNSYQTLIHVFKIKHNMTKNNITVPQGHSNHDYPTRRKSDFYLNKPNTNLNMNDFYYRGFKLFNELPDAIKRTNNISSFKDSIRKYLVAQWKS